MAKAQRKLDEDEWIWVFCGNNGFASPDPPHRIHPTVGYYVFIKDGWPEYETRPPPSCPACDQTAWLYVPKGAKRPRDYF